jgi:hypothetical protein
MPVVLRIGLYTFLFYSNESNEPPHIHIRRDKDQAKFWLSPVELAYNGKYPVHELRRLRELVIEHRALLIRSWNDYFEGTEN